jgi:spore coat polysaccharide biosynthesis protein SpsF
LCELLHDGAGALRAGDGKAIGIIAGRMDSRRLPGKMLSPLCGAPLLQHVVTRAKQVPNLSKVVLATSSRGVDDPLAELGASLGLAVFRGSLEDVAGRFLACALHHRADYFVRINGDSPLLDPELIGRGLALVDGGFDLISNIVTRTFPYGISVEIVRTEMFRLRYPSFDAEQCEHVTKALYQQPAGLAIHEIVNDAPLNDAQPLTVDVPGDVERLEALLAGNPGRCWREIVGLKGAAT